MKARYAIVAALCLAITGCSRTPAWQTYTSAEGSFTVELPGPPQTRQADAELGEPEVNAVRLDERQRSYAVCWVDLTPRTGTNPLDKAGEKYAGPLAGQLVEERPVTIGRHSGREWIFRIGQPKGHVTVRAFVVNGRAYDLVAVAPDAVDPAVQRFLESFKLLE